MSRFNERMRRRGQLRAAEFEPRAAETVLADEERTETCFTSRLGRGIRWSDLVAEMRSEQLARNEAVCSVAIEDAEAA